jgi:L-asparaginase / beta-aspartyl-peptidase
MIVISSKNGLIGIRDAMRALKNGGSAMDAVEAGIYPVDSNPEDHSVGYGGFPTILGEVELDASIMDGKTLRAGAVGCVKNYPHPISIARKVMEELPHVFLVGEGAERFAAEMGFAQQNQLSDATHKEWEAQLRLDIPAEVFDHLKERKDLAHWVKVVSEPKKAKGTVNFIAMDAQGNLCTGVSTSGWYAKYPGRLGDSPMIGAGNYADNRYGAAACTGMGEMAIRAGTARSVVLYMKIGMTVEEAGRQAMLDLNDLSGPYLGDMNIVAMDKDGKPAAFSNNENAMYAIFSDQMSEPVLENRTYVETRKCWGEEA